MRLRAGIFIVSVLILVSPKSALPRPRKAGDIAIEAASLTTPAGEKINFELGTLFVPENRADPKSRIIGVGFARFRPPHSTGVPPVFQLDGGPGASFLEGLKPGKNNMPVPGIDLYRGIGDVVFIDQRGYSERGDVLKFKYSTTAYPLDQPTSIARYTADYVAISKAAVDAFTRRGFDLRGYDIRECADDVNDLRKALKYQRIILVGQSFGSQWAFAVMRRHREIVARALLFGVEPLNSGYDMPSDVLSAVKRMWREAEKDPRLKPYLPEGGLMAAAKDVLRRLDKAPVRVNVKNRKTGKTATIILGKEDFQRSFATERGGDQPAFILSLYYRHYDELAQSALAFRQAHAAEEAIIGPLIDTSLGVTPGRKQLLSSDPAIEFLGEWDSRSYLATAGIWPSTDVGDEFRNEIKSDIPVVFVHGDWDTSTPVENTLSVSPYFKNGRVLIVEHGKHAALKRMVEQAPETVSTLMEFVRTGNTAKLPPRLVLPVPKFAMPKFPPLR